MSASTFRQHMLLLRRSGAVVVSLEELHRRLLLREPIDRLVAITFDDAYTDVLEHALPVLRSYELPATIFVPVGFVGGASSWSAIYPHGQIMTVQDIEAVRRQGFDLGSHSVHHKRLTQLSDAELHEELAASRDWLRSRYDVQWMAFAYPFGDAREREFAAAERAGYECAVGFGGILGNGYETGRYALNRDAIEHSCDERALERIISGVNDLKVIGQSLQAVGRR